MEFNWAQIMAWTDGKMVWHPNLRDIEDGIFC